MYDIARLVTANLKTLILGSANDPHVQAVARCLKRPFEIIDFWSGPPSVALGMESSHDGVLSIGTERVGVSGLWNRLKPSTQTWNSESLAFRKREWEALLLQLPAVLGLDFRCLMNDTAAQAHAAFKLVQLTMARDAGFAIPATFATNNPELVAAFLETKRIIHKVVTWLGTSDGKVGFTNEVVESMIAGNGDAIALAPSIYQELIPKAREYRVTIVDDEIFCAFIYSQEQELTSVDWRRDQLNVHYECGRLPDSVETSLRVLMRSLRLRFGAVDLIETPQGEVVFLEVNPEGNWLWLEKRLSHFPISCRIAASLEYKHSVAR